VGADFKFLLPTHKTNTTFEGNWVHIAQIIGAPNPKPIMVNNICSHDQLIPLHPCFGFARMAFHQLGHCSSITSSNIALLTLLANQVVLLHSLKLVLQWSLFEVLAIGCQTLSNSSNTYKKIVVVLHALILRSVFHYSPATQFLSY
jgi:hypothetical protein